MHFNIDFYHFLWTFLHIYINAHINDIKFDGIHAPFYAIKLHTYVCALVYTCFLCVCVSLSSWCWSQLFGWGGWSDAEFWGTRGVEHHSWQKGTKSYLGVILSTCCVFSHASSDLAAKAHIGIIGILKVLSLEDCNPFLFFKLFDTQIQPIFL